MIDAGNFVIITSNEPKNVKQIIFKYLYFVNNFV
jgi:hypothetical protein